MADLCGSQACAEQLGNIEEVCVALSSKGKHANVWIWPRFTYRTVRKNARFAKYQCVETACNWQVNASRTKNGPIRLKVIHSSHTCGGSAIAKRGSASHADWLHEMISGIILVTKSTKPHEIVAALQLHYAEKINYTAAYRLKQHLLSNDIGAHRHSFQLLPLYRDHLAMIAPGAVMDLQLDPSNST